MNNYAQARKKTRRMIKWASLAACVCLILTGVIHTLARLDLFTAACSGITPGYIVDGVHYYSVRHDGVYAYSPEDGARRRIVGKYFYDDWAVNSYGLYYRRGRAIYVIPHETGKTEKLYADSSPDITHIRFEVTGDGVVITEYNKNADPITYTELLLDMMTGEVMGTLTETSPTSVPGYTETHYTVGDRALELCGITVDGGTFFELYCDGVTLLPEGYVCSQYPVRLGDAMMFELWHSRGDGSGSWDGTYVVCHPDGTDTVVSLPDGAYGMTGTSDFCFFSVPGGERTYDVLCLDTHTGQTWTISGESTPDTYELTCDGEYLYSGAPWSDELCCWRVVYEDGRPASLSLVSENIAG